MRPIDWSPHSRWRSIASSCNALPHARNLTTTSGLQPEAAVERSSSRTTNDWCVTATLATLVVITALLMLGATADCRAAEATARRKVVIDQDAFGPAGSNMQAILLLLQSKDVEVLGITVTTG